MQECIISPIFYMGNKRKLINKGLIDLFPVEIDTFLDLFGGSGIISMNVNANRYIVNDLDKNVYAFYKMFKTVSHEEIIQKILENINKFGMNRIGVKQNSPESETYKERYFDLRNYANKTKNIIDIYSCMFYAFSQQMRFNSKGDFNMPFGNGAFTETNEEYIKNGCKFFSNQNVLIGSVDFRKLPIDRLKKNDFVYLDPPYFNTTATYNENGGWTEQDEVDLFALCEKLNKNGVKWGMSNVFKCKDKVNEHLINWCENNNWNVHTFNKFTYMACGKGNSNATEVFITNY